MRRTSGVTLVAHDVSCDLRCPEGRDGSGPDRAGRLPPGVAGMERLLGFVADFGRDRTGNDECSDAVGVQVRRGTVPGG